MYFPDLAPYSYYLDKPLDTVRTVGWLDPHRPFPTAELSSIVVDRLIRVVRGSDICNVHVNILRSVRPCDLCHDQAFLEFDPRLMVGQSQIWLPSRGETFLAAPSMILHYILLHKYAPPREFLSAIENFDFDKKV